MKKKTDYTIYLILIALLIAVLSSCVYIPPPQKNGELVGTWTESIKGESQLIVSEDSVFFLLDGEGSKNQTTNAMC